MIFKYFIYTVSFILLVFTLSACQSENTSSVSILEEQNIPIPTVDKPETRPYNNILNRMWYVIKNEKYKLTFAFQAGERGVSEVASYSADADKALDTIGYCVKDISGDGTPELLIGSETKIYAAFTSSDNTPKLIFEGSSNSYYTYADNGILIYNGSGTESSNIFGDYTISKDGSELICNDFYFSLEKTETSPETKYYHNKTSEWDSSVSDEISEEDFNAALSSFKSKATKIDFVPFSTWQ